MFVRSERDPLSGEHRIMTSLRGIEAIFPIYLVALKFQSIRIIKSRVIRNGRPVRRHLTPSQRIEERKEKQSHSMRVNSVTCVVNFLRKTVLSFVSFLSSKKKYIVGIHVHNSQNHNLLFYTLFSCHPVTSSWYISNVSTKLSLTKIDRKYRIRENG